MMENDKKHVVPEGASYKKLELFESGMATPDGLTGGEDDPVLIRMALVQNTFVHWDYPFERHNLFDNPKAFIQNETVAGLLRSDGDEAFPCLLVDGKLAIKGRYPTMDELMEYTGVENLNDAIIPFSPEQIQAIKARAQVDDSCAGSCAGCQGCG